MSILGYSASYFLPEYWSGTPFYGEKLIPLLDYVLSTDYSKTAELASAFYNMQNKYKNTADLPIEQIEDLIQESGYGYVRDLLGNDEESIRLLVYLLVLIHQYKGSGKGIELVLNLLKKTEDSLLLSITGNPDISLAREVSGITVNDYVLYSGFSVGTAPFEISFQFRTNDQFKNEQCIASSPDHGFYLGIDTQGKLVVRLGEFSEAMNMRKWQTINGSSSFYSDRTFQRSTNYYMFFSFDGAEYSIRVSTDGVRYEYFKIIPSSTPLNIVAGYIYIGVDKSETEEARYPFLGYISLAPFSVTVNSIQITQWFEDFPVGDENTFVVEAELDLEIVSTNFFANFSNFVKNYVYPTLKAFRAKVALRNKLTFLPWVRHRVTYVAMGDLISENFNVVEEQNEEEHTPFKVKAPKAKWENYKVVKD